MSEEVSFVRLARIETCLEEREKRSEERWCDIKNSIISLGVKIDGLLQQFEELPCDKFEQKIGFNRLLIGWGGFILVSLFLAICTFLLKGLFT